MAKSSDKSGSPAIEKKAKSNKPKNLPPFHVILLDDDDHTHEYVAEMLLKLFGYDATKGMTLAKEVGEAGRAVVFTSHQELAELKRELIHGFGADLRVATCKGSMSAIIEAAPA